MRARTLLCLLGALLLISSVPGLSSATKTTRIDRRPGRADSVPAGFVPAVARNGVGRYFVVLRAPSLAARVRSERLRPAAQRAATRAVLDSQRGAAQAVKALGGKIVFRYARLLNGLSAQLSSSAARKIAARPDVASVQPVSVVAKANETSVPFIGAPEVWDTYGVKGQGMRVAVVDSGIDYTHADFGGEGTVEAYESNDPTYIESGSFPTAKVIGGYDFVGEDYDVLDDDPTNDIPVPDYDPLDFDGHGTHTAGTCCGKGVQGIVGAGVAPKAKIYGYRVWDVGNSTDDVLVAAYERAIDPDQDGSTDDHVDVLSFSGGVTYGTLNSVEAVAAQRVVDIGTVFVASAGNSGNQPAGGTAYKLGTPASARGVIAVAAGVDQFAAQTLTVNDPPGLVLPEGGVVVHQDWSAPIDADITNDVLDGREWFPPSDPGGEPSPTDQQFCEAVAGEPLAGQLALVFKGSTGAGDCDGSSKVFFAQEAGATGVILWSGFAGAPFGLGPGEHADEIDIPAVMVSTADGAALGDAISPDAPTEYNTGALNVTIHAGESVIPGFENRITDFSSEGPARVTNDLKPDITAPGSDIDSAAVGTGTEAIRLSGTSMSAPHVSGTATLLRQLHPGWSPEKIKASLMNQSNRNLKDVNGFSPVPAEVQGAGMVRVDRSANADSIAWPGSLSYGLDFAAGPESSVQTLTVKNYDDRTHSYEVTSNVRYSDYDEALTTIRLSKNGSTFQDQLSFHLKKGVKRTLWVKLKLDPSVISAAQQEYGHYFFFGSADGVVKLKQGGGRPDKFGVPWHVVPRAASSNSGSPDTLDLSGGSAAITLDTSGAAVSYADAFLLGDTDEVDSQNEEDITETGARSFTGSTIDGTAEGLPSGLDPFAGISWVSFLTNADEPTEPVEFAVRTHRVHDTTETYEVDVKVDAGADGVFADPEMQADYLVVKPPASGTTCVFDLSLPDPLDECTATYFPDYSNYNSNLTGLVVDAAAVGLSDAEPELAYSVTVCAGTFSGDVPGQVCDDAGAIDETTGTYTARLNATDPSLQIDPLVCGGFWGDSACAVIDVSIGSAGPDDTPSVLLLYPNNPPATSAQVIETTQ